MFVLRDGAFVPVKIIDVLQPRNQTSLKYIEIEGTGERLLVPNDELIASFPLIGDEGVASLYYPRPSETRSHVGSFRMTTSTWGDIPTKVIVRTLPVYDDTQHNAGWYQVVESTKDGSLHLVPVTGIASSKSGTGRS